jgi:type I restriction enzyme S subunit
MRAYTEYSQIDAKWLGVIPSHWDCKKIGTLFSQRKEKVSDKDFAPLSVTKNGILPQLSNAAKSNDGDNRKLVRTGDFVINSRSDRKGSCGVSSSDGSVSLINIVLTPRQDLNSRYVHYLLRSQPFSEEYYRYGRGIVADLWTTRYSEMKNIYIPIPPRSEQDQIVCYLDWQVSKINKLIAAKKKETDELIKLEQSIIFHYVSWSSYFVTVYSKDVLVNRRSYSTVCFTTSL